MQWSSTGIRWAWLLVLGYWAWSARRARPTERREPWWTQLLAYWLPLAAAVLLLGEGEWYGHSWLREQFVPHSTLVHAIALATCTAGAALAIWSRYLLGSNWSSVVELKAGHQLVETGPYRFIRHPIYTGLLLLFLGNALQVGDWRGLLAVAIVLASFWRKLKLEEAWLGERFGATWQAYAQRTRALVPGIL
jgi:protein-S-isoprenylcysteine O-methyltransferase Ste14